MLVVDTQILHASHKLLVANRKIFGEFRDSSEEQGAGQVQRSDRTEKTVYAPRLVLCLNQNTLSTLMPEKIHEKFIIETLAVLFSPQDIENRNRINMTTQGEKSFPSLTP